MPQETFVRDFPPNLLNHQQDESPVGLRRREKWLRKSEQRYKWKLWV